MAWSRDRAIKALAACKRSSDYSSWSKLAQYRLTKFFIKAGSGYRWYCGQMNKNAKAQATFSILIF
jgi:hypothetical protein